VKNVYPNFSKKIDRIKPPFEHVTFQARRCNKATHYTKTNKNKKSN
jgi:hypothetical protein